MYHHLLPEVHFEIKMTEFMYSECACIWACPSGCVPVCICVSGCKTIVLCLLDSAVKSAIFLTCYNLMYISLIYMTLVNSEYVLI